MIDISIFAYSPIISYSLLFAIRLLFAYYYTYSPIFRTIISYDLIKSTIEISDFEYDSYLKCLVIVTKTK